MQSIDSTASAPSAREPVSAAVGTARLATGLIQGIALYLLEEARRSASWPVTEPVLFLPLLLVAVFVPPILVSSLGHASRRQLLAWVATAAVSVALLAAYDAWRVGGYAAAPGPVAHGAHSAHPSGQLVLCLIAGLFIAHSLFMAAVRDQRRIASYPSYFEIAWKFIVQLAFSGFFVGVFWLVLLLGAQLFQLIQLSFLNQLLSKQWFAIPVTTTAWAFAMHMTDMRPAIVRSIRNLLLALMSWALPVMSLLVAGFLLSLPATGFAPLWATRHAAAVLLGTAGAFVVLINAARQDGESAAAKPIRLSARLAAVLLVPVTAIAAYALGLRVADHGWTVDRVIAAACVLVASCYALGYATAALRDTSLAQIAKVNIWTAMVVLATIVLLLSPVADPARLAVNSQVARLTSGKVPVEKFDFAYLRFEGARYGQAALAQLGKTASGPKAALLRERIAQAGKITSTREPEAPLVPPDNLLNNLRVWPKGAVLPPSFLGNRWNDMPVPDAYPDCLREAGKKCDAVVVDLSGDGKPEIIVLDEIGVAVPVLHEDAQGHWQRVGTLTGMLGMCRSFRDSLIAGDFRVVPPLVSDLEIGGQRVRLGEAIGAEFRCPEKKPARPPG